MLAGSPSRRARALHKLSRNPLGTPKCFPCCNSSGTTKSSTQPGTTVSRPVALSDIEPKDQISTAPTTLTFPESLSAAVSNYKEDIGIFADLVSTSSSTANLLERIRNLSASQSTTRMSCLKLFRRCVSPVCDTEMTKKIRKVPTKDLVDAYGNTFKDIKLLKKQFSKPTSEVSIAALSALLSENDSRGQSGYWLTGCFFDWFSAQPSLREFEASGPRGAGRDIELSTELAGFPLGYPCDIIIKRKSDKALMVAGFARYDSTRGGSQSDDRTSGNANKVEKARRYQEETGRKFRLLFLADGPGLLHHDTWNEACDLDGQLDGAVRVTTLKLLRARVTPCWISGLNE